MKATLIAWAQSKGIVGFEEKQFEYEPSESVYDVIQRICGDADALQFCRIAVNQKMHSWKEPIGLATEVAIIPPVSGG
jgi:molybdopterin converting factor small subunit